MIESGTAIIRDDNLVAFVPDSKKYVVFINGINKTLQVPMETVEYVIEEMGIR